MGRSLALRPFLCLHFLLSFGFALDFVNVLDFKYGVGIYQTCSEASPGPCATSVAFAQNWDCLAGTFSIAEDLQGSWRPSFSRLWAPTSYCESNAISKCALALPAVQAAAQTQCFSLPDLSLALADGDGSHLHPWYQAVGGIFTGVSTAVELSWRTSILPGGAITSQSEVPTKIPEPKEENTQRRQRKGQCWVWSSYAVPTLSAFAASGLSCYATIAPSEWTTTLGASWCSYDDAYDEHDAHAEYSSTATATMQSCASFCPFGSSGPICADRDAGAGAQRIAQLSASSVDLPLDVQQKVQSESRKQGKRAIKDLQVAAKSLGEARTAYEEALLARTQHISSWKSFLAEAVKNWTDYAKMFEQNEQALQMRISSAREQFQEAKECLDASKTAAGQVTEISDEEELPGDSETSAMQITESIQTLSNSLLKLSKDAESIQVEGPAAKRPRMEESSAGEDSKQPFS